MSTNGTSVQRYVVKIGVVFLLFSHSVKTVNRNWDWENDRVLFSSAVKVTKQSAKMWDFIGTTNYKGGDLPLAEAAFRKAIEVEPQYTPAYGGIVRLLKKVERFEEAIEVRKIGKIIILCYNINFRYKGV